MPDRLPPLALLAGGLATRLRPLTERIPKSLLLVDGEPFLAHQLRLLARQGIRNVVICCGHFGEQIEAFAGSGESFGCRIEYSYDGDTLLGTGGALKQALPLLGDNFFVMYGDSYLLAEPSQAWAAYVASAKPVLMTVYRNEDRWDRSNVDMREGRIVSYDKHRPNPSMRHIDYGLGVIASHVLSSWNADGAFDLAAVYAQLASAGELAAYEVHSRFYEIGSPNGLLMTSRYLEQARLASAAETAIAGAAR